MRKTTVEASENLNVSTILWHFKRSADRVSTTALAYRIERLAERSTQVDMVGAPRLQLRFTATHCYFGGLRHWFRCPACGRRVGKLYAPLSASAFKCRRCHDLTYRSTQEHDARVDRLSKRLDQIGSQEGEEALAEAIRAIRRTRRGCRLLERVYDKRRPRFPPPFLARRGREERSFEAYVQPLLERG